MAGAFYRILVDGQPAAFAATALRGVMLYTVCTLLQATSRWVSEYIALGYKKLGFPSISYAHVLLTARARRTLFAAGAGNFESMFPTSQRLLLRCRVRAVIARRLQSLYCRKHAFLDLSQASTQRRTHIGNASGQSVPVRDEAIDNADQRMTADVIMWTQLLRGLLPTFGAAPFKIVFYTWWMQTFTGWQPVLMVYLFFLIGSILQR